MVAFHQQHPKCDQNPWFAPQPFHRGVPPHAGTCSDNLLVACENEQPGNKSIRITMWMYGINTDRIFHIETCASLSWATVEWSRREIERFAHLLYASCILNVAWCIECVVSKKYWYSHGRLMGLESLFHPFGNTSLASYLLVHQEILASETPTQALS